MSKYKILVSVNEEVLMNTQEGLEEDTTISGLVESEMGWVQASGISVWEVNELVKEGEKLYEAEVSVDKEVLKSTHEDLDEEMSVIELIETEMGWVAASGIYVQEIKEG